MNFVTCVNIADDSAVGRLGNKMFIIAAGLGTAKRHIDGEFKIPDWQYKDIFPNIPSGEIDYNGLVTYQEKKFSFDMIPCIERCNIQGYFQSEKYFKFLEDEIKDVYFDPCEDVKKEVDELFGKKGDIRITSIHVRRGDYLNLQHYHPVQTKESYFNEAIEEMDSITDRYMVFSDDITWCKENFKGEKFLFSENQTSLVDMFMIASCDNHIISNSSYSWWGAWLCKNKDKKVIAPSRWFGPQGTQDWQDVYAEDWIEI